MTDWHRHWNLDRDPFDPRAPAFVAAPPHAEAVARLVHAIEAAERSARLVAAPGLGKSAVLARAIELARAPNRRFGRASGPIDGASLFASLAAGLGARVDPGAGRGPTWRALGEAARVCAWQGQSIVLAVDDCQTLASASDRGDLDRLDHLAADPSARLTVIRVGRPEADRDGDEPEEWGLPIRLGPLRRSEAADYVEAKLRAAGRDDPTFTPRALTLLHARSGGVPRGIDRIAALALMAGSARGLEMVTPEVVDQATLECKGPAGGMATASRVR